MSQSDHSIDHQAGVRASSDEDLGLAGRTARFFIRSPLSPLFYISMLLMGLLGLVMTPRQEDPQISVPMVDIFVQYPGTSATQVDNLAIQPLERIMSEIPGVKHVYSATMRGQGIVTIEFDVGQKMGPSLVKVNDKLDSNKDLMPPGVMPPLVKAKGIDDVPVVNITLWSKDLDGDGIPDVDDGQLRMLALDVMQSLKEIPNTANSFVVGGRSEQMTVEVSPERLAGYGISLDQVAQAIQTANAEAQAGGVESQGTRITVLTGSFLRTADDINRLVVGAHDNAPVYVHDVARVWQGPEDATHLVAYYTGPAGSTNLKADGAPAVTIAVAKKEGTNGVTVANAIIKRVMSLKGTRIPSNVAVSITRDYGKTANDKVNELIFKLFVATGFVFILVLGAFRALKPALVVVLVIPVVLLMTVFSAWLTGYTIDRVSLFALIFSIGILVDDAIVVVENIYRRWLEEGKTDEETAVDAVREVGNPTILATFTVIAALLPMGFVSGMMGPYMEPIPALGSAAMLISLFAAFVFTPYLAISKWLRPTMHYLEVAEKREHKEAEMLEGMFRRILTPLIESRTKQLLFRLGMWSVFLFTCSFFYFKWVAVKMLPLDNKPEFSVVLDMPEGTALPVTANMLHNIAEAVGKMPEVTAMQAYAGTAKPFDFNGMVRHYYLRSDPWDGELQVQLLDKHERHRSSHEIATEARKLVTPLVQGTGAHFAVVEMPPGPPVLQSVVAEVHGPSADVRRQVARDLTAIFAEAPSTRDVDNYLRDPSEYWRFDVDTEKSVRRGISVDAINRNLSMALGGTSVGDVKQRAGHEPVKIVIQVPLAMRSEVARLGDLPIMSQSGASLPLRELGEFHKVPVEDIIYHKDLRSIEYVVADVGGKLAAPVYAMFQVEDLLKSKRYVAPDGVPLEAYWLGPPPDDHKSAFEWTGEWTVTYETFRDMGAAFMVALVLIYILVVWEFGNFRIPLIIMAPIPLTLLGIIPAHFIMFHLGKGGEFTATSMIGWIALAGIIVRNSILLVDFSIHEVQRGIPVAEAVIRACKTRTRPIMITALALVCGSSVIFTDPIFQGMAISLASGVMVSTILTLIVIPLGCIKSSKALCQVAAATAPAGQQFPCETGAPVAAAAKRRSRPSWGMAVWGKVANVLILLFYAVRGIGLLLGQLLKPRPKPAPRSATPPPSPPAPSGGNPPGGSGGGGGVPQGGGGAGPGPVPAAFSSGGGGGAAGGTPSAQAAPSTVQSVGEDAIAAQVQQPAEVSARRVPEAKEAPPGLAVAAPATPRGRQDSSTPVPADPLGIPADVPSAVAQGGEKGTAQTGGREPAGPLSHGGSKRVGQGRSRRPEPVRATSASVGQTAAIMQKKGPRRGIRLKLGDEGPDADID
jgi:multidrug efflux pump subunit AcrB